jgi:small GTP-binding protein
MSRTSDNNELYIGIFGKKNSGKSTLINALTGLNTILPVSDATTDPTYISIELNKVGPCILIDTAGFDKGTFQDQMKIEAMRLVMEKSDIALIVCSEENITKELDWAKAFKERNIPVVMVINKIDQISNTDKMRNRIYNALKEEPVKISAISRIGIETVKEEIIRIAIKYS